MAAGAVGKAALPATRIFGLHGDGELQGADIDTTAGKKFCGRLVHEWLLELICDPASAPGQLLAPTLNMQAHQAFDSPRRQKERGGGRSFARLNFGLRDGLSAETRLKRSRVWKSKIQGWEPRTPVP